MVHDTVTDGAHRDRTTAAADSALQLTAKELAADGVVTLTLEHPEGRRLPDWAPGAHIDLMLSSGLTRQYSLCGDRWDPYRYRVGVLREPSGRGGSAYVHDVLEVGDPVGVGGPRNNFPMVPSPKYLFIAGGIGITPLVPMVVQAELMNAAWTLVYGGRTLSSMAFVDELCAYGDRVVLAPADEVGPLDLASYLDEAGTDETKVYVCGPSGLLTAVEAQCAAWPVGKLRTERFVPKEQSGTARAEPFEVELARSRTTVTVLPHSTVLDAVREAGVNVLSSAAKGPAGPARRRCCRANRTTVTPSSTTTSAPRPTACSSVFPGRAPTASYSTSDAFHSKDPLMTSLAPTTDVPVSRTDPFDLDVLEDPHSFHGELRDAGPVVYLESHGVFGLARYEQVQAALTDWQGFQSAAGVGLSNFRYEKPWRPPSLLLETDPPHHDAPRAVLSKVLGPRALMKLRESWLLDAKDLVDQVLGSATEFDVVSELAATFPLRVFPDAVGIPNMGRENLLPYGDHLFNAFGPSNSLVTKGASRVAELSGWVNDQCSRESLSSDGFGAQIWSAADRGDITYEQAPLIVRSLLSAGVDTTVNGLAAVLFAFANNPDQWARLRTDPSSYARSAFDEAVRWESPVQTFFRTATRDIEIEGVVIPDGHKILMFLGSANRDPRHWERPDAFDITRDPSGHVGYGMGIHQCVGQHVARLEAEALLTALASRVAAIEPIGSARRHLNNTLRSWESIPVRMRL